MKTDDRVFWLVWNESRGLPKMKHWSADEARREAERLARSSPGEEFHVLELRGTCGYAVVTWRTPVDAEDVPF